MRVHVLCTRLNVILMMCAFVCIHQYPRTHVCMSVSVYVPVLPAFACHEKVRTNLVQNKRKIDLLLTRHLRVTRAAQTLVGREL